MDNGFALYKYWLKTDEENDICDDTREVKKELIEALKETPSYQARAKVNGVIQPLVAVRDRKKARVCKVTAVSNDNLHVGDLVDVYKEKWIIIEAREDEYGISSGEMWMCNQVFTYQKFSGEIVEKNAIIDDGSYSTKTEKAIDVATNTYKCYMQLDDDSKELYIDKRLAIDVAVNSDGKEILEVGKIVWLDKKSVNFGEGSHLLSFKLERDVFNSSKDSVEQMLCDYRSISESEPESATNTIAISGRTSLRIGTTREYKANIIDENGNIVEGNFLFNWELRDAPNGVSISPEEQSCKISCAISDKMIGKSFTIVCYDTERQYPQGELTVEVVNG